MYGVRARLAVTALSRCPAARLSTVCPSEVAPSHWTFVLGRAVSPPFGSVRIARVTEARTQSTQGPLICVVEQKRCMNGGCDQVGDRPGPVPTVVGLESRPTHGSLINP